MSSRTADLILLGAILLALVIAQTSYYRSAANEHEICELRTKINELEQKLDP